MNPIDRLYKKGNSTKSLCINIEDTLYEKIAEITTRDFEANNSDVINVAIEILVQKEHITYYPKPENEIAIYKNIMIRKSNIKALKDINRKTGISVTRLVNIAMKEFVDNYKKI